jgi:hypothetical protein
MASKFDRLMMRFERPIIRLAVIGIGLVIMYLSVSILLNVEWAEGANQLKAREHAAQYASHARNRAERECAKVLPTKKQDCTQDIYDRAREHQRREYEVEAQRDSALWDEAMGKATIYGGILGFLTVAVLVYGFILQAQANKITKEAAENTLAETRRIGEAQVRCYLTGVSAKVAFLEKGRVFVICVIKNTGQSPAKRVFASGEVALTAGGGLKVFSEPLNKDQSPARVDIAYGSEEELSFSVLGTMDGWDKSEGGGFYFISVNIKLSAADVFDLPVAEVERFCGNPYELPKLNSWIELKRAARLT